MKWAVSLFRFFASLKLAVFLLTSLALIFAVGTFAESAYGTEAASLLVYRGPWMALLLMLLALNLAASALDRLPWKKKHVGFVVTHLGIILILTGALVTRAFGIEGQMAVAEGETASRVILAEPKLQLLSRDSRPLASYSVPRTAFPWKGKKLLLPLSEEKSLPAISLLRYYPKAGRETEVREAANGSPALKVALESSFMKTSHWLFLEDAGQNHILLGPAELRFSKETLPHEKESPEKDFLEFQFPDSVVKVPLPDKAPHKISLEGTPYQVTVLRILKDAVVDGNRLADQSEEWKNPACELRLEGEGLEERHTVFLNFPDFPTLHGLKPSAAGVRIFYRRAGTESAGPKNELRFVWRETGLPFYQIRKGGALTPESKGASGLIRNPLTVPSGGRDGEISGGELKLGEEYATGWMDFKFRAETYYPHARTDTRFHEEPVQSQAEDHLSAVEIELESKGERKTLWLGQGDREPADLDGQMFQIVYGLRTLPVGFRVKLRDFRVAHDPGTRRPASFESDVTLMDDSSGVTRDSTIRMNQPLKHAGFKVFQSGYQQPEGGPEVSIFTVAKDPGIPFKYAGAVVLIGGILIMFYSKQFSNRPKQELVTNR